MEKLIITVACDSRTSYPINHHCPPQEDIDGVAQQYIDGIKAGEKIVTDGQYRLRPGSRIVAKTGGQETGKRTASTAQASE